MKKRREGTVCLILKGQNLLRFAKHEIGMPLDEARDEVNVLLRIDRASRVD